MNDQTFVKSLLDEATATPARPRTVPVLSLGLSLGLALAVAAGGGWAWSHRDGATSRPAGQAAARQAEPPHVDTAVTSRGDVPVQVTGLGTVQPFNTVTVKPRVSGQIRDIAFTEGQMVHAGDVLAHIDPKPFLPALHQAEANLDKDQAQLRNATADLKRTTSLAQSGYATGQALDTQKSQQSVLQAQIEADQAAVESSQTQIDFTTIASPISGIAGLRLVDAGNMIATSDPGIVTINQLEPIAVVFSVPSEAIGHWAVGRPEAVVPVTALSPDGRRTLAMGSLSLVDNHIDPMTATIRLKASFPNADRRLKPGQFVNARMRSALLEDVLSVPSAAVQEGTSGPWVYLVQPDGTLAQRTVSVDRVVGDRSVIASGLDAGDAVVTSGHYSLRPGMAVDRSAAPTPGPIADRSQRTE